MKIILLTIMLVACNTSVDQNPVAFVEQEGVQEKSDYQTEYKRKVTDLKSFKDSSKFIGRLGLQFYNETTIIEFIDSSNLYKLSVKQTIPQKVSQSGVVLDNILYFNETTQILNQFEGKLIAKWFKPYNSQNVINTDTFSGRLNHHHFFVEVFDHGHYSYYATGTFVLYDEKFIKSLKNKAVIATKGKFEIFGH